ncbi:MAG: DUF4012 domain-containing protein, partial [Actinomycetota bacterium]
VGVLEARDGRMDLVRTRPDNDLVPLAAPALEMPAWYVRHYDRHRARTLWSNVSMEPDFPTTAPLIAAYYSTTFGEPVDGVIAIDPFALERILRATGPVPGPEGITFDEGNVARFVMSDSYARFPDQTRRKTVVLEAAHVVFERLKTGVDAAALATALASAVRDKHVMVWMRSSAPQRALQALGADGRFGAPGRASIGVVTQNAAENKIDYYLRRTIRLELRLRADGVADGTLRVRLDNLAPDAGLPRDVIGPITKPEGRGRDPSRFVAGLNVSWLNASLPPGALVLAWRVDGRAAASDQTAAPHAVISSLYLEVPSRASTEATLWFRLPPGPGWNGRRLALLVPRQPTAAPDQVEIVVAAPDGRRLYPGGRREFAVRTATNGDIPVDVVVRRPLWARFSDWL